MAAILAAQIRAAIEAFSRFIGSDFARFVFAQNAITDIDLLIHNTHGLSRNIGTETINEIIKCLAVGAGELANTPLTTQIVVIDRKKPAISYASKFSCVLCLFRQPGFVLDTNIFRDEECDFINGPVSHRHGFLSGLACGFFLCLATCAGLFLCFLGSWLLGHFFRCLSGISRGRIRLAEFAWRKVIYCQ